MGLTGPDHPRSTSTSGPTSLISVRIGVCISPCQSPGSSFAHQSTGRGLVRLFRPSGCSPLPGLVGHSRRFPRPPQRAQPPRPCAAMARICRTTGLATVAPSDPTSLRLGVSRSLAAVPRKAGRVQQRTSGEPPRRSFNPLRPTKSQSCSYYSREVGSVAGAPGIGSYVVPRLRIFLSLSNAAQML